MALKLMYITNKPEVAEIIDEYGVDRIFLDLEIIGKEERQGHLDTVISKHSINDVAKLRKVIKKGELLVRCNPVNDGTQHEIDKIVHDGADIIMLPYFKTVKEVEVFLKCVNGRVKTMLLFETPQAVEIVDYILSLDGIDEVHIGLNDLHIGYGLDFMFELLTNGVVERLCSSFAKKGIPYGIGGIAALGKGTLNAEYIIAEHYRLGSSGAILSRSFSNLNHYDNIEDFKLRFLAGLTEIRNYENILSAKDEAFFTSNRETMSLIINNIVNEIKSKRIM